MRNEEVKRLRKLLKDSHKREELLMKAYIMAGDFGCHMTICEECDAVHTEDFECPLVCENCGENDCECEDEEE
tara:strand:+ start:246 stop:464 length:219 start_codon:yes stop_codon:yes gene_type:complete